MTSSTAWLLADVVLVLNALVSDSFQFHLSLRTKYATRDYGYTPAVVKLAKAKFEAPLKVFSRSTLVSLLNTGRPDTCSLIFAMFFAKFLGRARAPTNINSLPDNILCMIFRAVVFSPARRSLRYKTPLTNEECSSPFSLLQVSLKWRSIVRGMGEIWRSIFIKYPSRKHIERTSIWMQHSGNNPLRITVITKPTQSEEEQEHLYAILDILATKLDYWEAVVFEFNGRLPAKFTHLMTELRNRSEPMLKNFILYLRPIPTEVLQVLTIWGAVNTMPSLRSFRWDCAHTPGLQLSSLLETLDLSSPIAVDDVLTRLSPCKSLRTLRVRKITASANDFNPVACARLEFAHLRELVLQAAAEDTDLTVLLEHIHAPALVVLGLKNIRHALFPAVARLCDPAANTLYGVSLAFAHRPAEKQVLDWLWMPQLQDIERLSMTGVRVTDAILDALTIPAHSTAMPLCLPSVESLHLGTVRTGVDGAVVLRMLGSRFWPPPPACAMHEMDGVNVDKERVQQLKRATILVSEAAHTAQLKRYQTMFKQSVASTPGWGDRELEFEVV